MPKLTLAFQAEHKTKQFTTSDNISISYNTNFSKDNFDHTKPLLVFNYGLACSNNHWTYQLEYFHKENFQILIHDYRGHYQSSGAENIDECNFKNMAKDIMELIKYVGVSKKIIMLGHSMGVNITLEFAKSYPDLVHKMILISGSIFPPQDVMLDSPITGHLFFQMKNFSKNFPEIFKPIWKYGYKNLLFRKMIHIAGFNTGRVSDEFVQIYLKKIGELPEEIFFKHLEEMKKQDILNHLPNILTKALIMGGDRDKVIPAYLQEILASKLPKATLYIIKDGSHVPQADFADSVNERIKVFISS